MRVVHAQGVLRSSDIVPQHQVQFIPASPPPGDGRDGIMGLGFRLRKEEHGFVAVHPPGLQNPVGHVHQPRRVLVGEAQHGHRPLDDSRLHILIAADAYLGLHRRFLHGEGIVSALEVVVGQNRSPHDGQIGVGAHKIMGELPHKVQQLGKTGPVDPHRHMLPVEADAVLIVVDIGGVLQEPGTAVDGNGNHAVVAAGGVVDPSRIALILGAELAPRIGRGR